MTRETSFLKFWRWVDNYFASINQPPATLWEAQEMYARYRKVR